ncbi:uncharacterized protein [Aristolochia californica]|uniref:uncharacterized protein n=1 Tax=Aristolochia californica TaxID=171875 RepID=UPI0035DBF875
MGADLFSFSKSLMGTPMLSLGKMMLSACASFIPWGLWNERNRRRFDAKSESFDRVADRVVGQISTWLLTKKVFSPYLGSSIRENWRNLALMHIGKKPPVMKEWSPPDPSFLKLNFDGSSLGNPGISGFRGVISNHSGNQLFTYVGPLGISDSTSAELHGLFSGLRIFRDKCRGPLHIEGDSKVVIGWCENASSPPWRHRDTFKEILDITSIIPCIWSHIPRSANLAANVFARQGATLQSLVVRDVLPQIL